MFLMTDLSFIKGQIASDNLSFLDNKSIFSQLEHLKIYYGEYPATIILELASVIF